MLAAEHSEDLNKLLNRMTRELLELQPMSKKALMIFRRIKMIAKRFTECLPSAYRRRIGRGGSL